MFHGVMRGLQGSDQQPDRNLVMHQERGAPVCTGKIRPFSLSILRTSVSLFALVALPVLCGPLNDTGIKTCGDSTGYSTALCTPGIIDDHGTFPRQDARYGRDAMQAGKGFSFTKIGNNGNDLPYSAGLGSGPSDWACTRDNVTGLMWEVKTTSGLRSKDNTYTWYNSNSATNGGDPGIANGGSCPSSGHCDTENFVADVNNVNTAGLCNAHDWRLPTVKELEQLADFGKVGPAIDTNYFPNTRGTNHFTSTPDALGNMFAWIVNFYSGLAMSSQLRSIPLPVRLVRVP